ncbi:uncharacterized protein LOC110093063 isoform X2 [Dendrobium catenatum]|uniref:uncharacterized protein LOC110093063 isoform X2 n=1 Tax=Dendrobium catenatum TaxID=906689 RepID=UPI00109FCD8C|nr:uncharacterized protein LOC110093063 isoform X2 [Dendrobium catenatum]
MAINHGDDMHKLEVKASACDTGSKENGMERDDHYTDIEIEDKHGNEVDSDYEPAKDSLSSHSNEDGKVKRNSRVPKKLSKKESGESYLRPTKVSSNRQEQKKLQFRTSNNGSKRSQKPTKVASTHKSLDNKKPEDATFPSRPSSEVSEEIDDKTIEEVKEIDVDDAPVCDQSGGTDDSVADTEENNLDDDKVCAYQKIEDMELKIEKLEEELMEVAALEISLYSVVPEHGSSAHKIHTPGRRLTRLYIHACKHLSQDKRASIAKNIASGLVLIARSCGNDVPRLTFWLSNIVFLRGIITQTFGHLSPSSMIMRSSDSNSSNKSASKLQSLKWKNISGGKQGKMLCLVPKLDDWQETSTFIAALQKIESWIFSRAVESVWWQALTPHMQPPVEDFYQIKGVGKLLGPALGDPQQGNFSVDLWKSAFHDAFSRLCPVRAGRHECGCSPVLLRLVMEQCINRLDVAMFNAILRESANEIPTDPVSDPIVDQKVLPVPAGDLSFGSGAQLKNSIGSWSRWLTDWFGMDVDNSVDDEGIDNKDDDRTTKDTKSKCFGLLNQLSDLLMLPKDMLLERKIRKEVCPSIGLPLLTRILCNFTPDEFCPEPVPGIVLEELNSERKTSMAQRKGYTSDEDFDDLDDPLASIIERTPPVSPAISGDKAMQNSLSSVRHKLLRDVWCE